MTKKNCKNSDSLKDYKLNNFGTYCFILAGIYYLSKNKDKKCKKKPKPPQPVPPQPVVCTIISTEFLEKPNLYDISVTNFCNIC